MMFKSMGKKVVYQGKSRKVIGFAPASKVNCGHGYALLLVIGGKSKYVNTSELAA
jgi:hypothetical protein